jgi:hypothetical protein|tara:strand:+ start:89 stop:307 length:219 start_codon:yes stop_codon:yes gene_type:complete
MTADRKTIDKLHEEVTQQLLLRVRSGEATASELSVAVKFLKDNGASLDVIMSDNPMASLLKELPFDVGEKMQ